MDKLLLFRITLFLLIVPSVEFTFAQSSCDPSTPTFTANLSANPNATWVSSPPVPRAGNCCGTSPPDKCIQFILTLSPQAVAINFGIASGAVPGGSMFYQVNCGPPQAVGTPLCLSGPGPYSLTFCKPGNNINTYSITSIPAPSVSPDDTVGNGCSGKLYASGLLVTSSLTWTSVFPGATGTYNSYLNCTSACDTVIVTPNASSPPYIDYLVCGIPVAGPCVSSGTWCDTVRVYVSPPITATITPNPAIFCASSGGISLNATVSGGVPPYASTWTNGSNGTGSVVANGNSYTATSAGNYSYIVYDKNYPKCPRAVFNVPVSVSPVPLVNAGPDQYICGSSATLGGSVSGATGGIWSGGSGNFSPSNTSTNAVYTPTPLELANGTVVLTLTSTGNGACSPVTDQVVLHFYAPIQVSLNAPSIICYGQTGSISANATGGIAPYTYHWSTGATTQGISNIGPGTYTVTVTSFGNNPCVGIATVTIPGNPQISVNTTSNNSISCNTTTVISASATGGTGAISYSWSNGATTQSTVVYSGTYVVTVTDANGCTASNAVNVITANSTLLVNVNQPPKLCYGATAVLTANATGGFGNYSYSWSNGSTSNSIVAGAGNYCVTVTDGNGCMVSGCATITQESPLNISAPAPATICNGAQASITAYANGGQMPYTYQWSSGQTTQTISQQAGTYNVTVTDAIGCSQNTSVTITQEAPLATTVSSVAVACYGGSSGSAMVNASGGTQPYYYSWTPFGGSSANAGGLPAGSYSVTVTDVTGCSTATAVTVGQPAPLTCTVASTSAVSCNGGNNGSATVNAGGGTPGYSYTWSPGGNNNATASNLGAGTYVVNIIDANGCVQSTQANITQPYALSAAVAGVTPVTCYGGSNGSASISVTGGSPGYTFAWSPGGATGQNANNLAAGTYTVNITDTKGCTTQAFVTIMQPSQPAATITSSSNASCFGGNNGQASVSASGGTGPYSYSWNTNPVQNTSTATNLSAGTYSATITDAQGCVVTSSGVTIGQPAILTASVTPSSLISCNTTINISASASGGSPGYSYQWNTGATATSINVPTGNYMVTITDGNGCTATGSVSVQAANSTLAASITQPANICFGSTITVPVNASGGFGSYTYQWNNGSTASSLTAGAGNYCVTVTDGNGCIANACVSINQNPPLNLTISNPSHVCPGATTNVSANVNGGQAPYSYLWNTGQNTSTVTEPAGTYTVTIHDASGANCAASATVTVSVEPPITISSSSTNVSCFGNSNGTATIYASGGTPGYTYNWLPSGGNSTQATGLAAGSYTAVVTDALGCAQTKLITITQPVSAVGVSLSSTNVLCYGQSTGTANANASGGTPGYTYYWWQTGDTTSSVGNLSAGTYTVSIADITGCYITGSVTVSQPPAIVLTATTTAANCGNSNGTASVTVSGGTPAYLYSWSPSGGNASAANNLPVGNYSCTVTDLNGCKESLVMNVPKSLSTLAPNFSSTTGCQGLSTNFTDVTTVSNDTVSAWAWDFGEPSSGAANYSGTQNPSHSFSSPGSFSVTLVVATQNGCTSSVVLPVTVYPVPTASFSAANACDNTVLSFSNTSSISGGATITNYSWNFGDPGSGLNNSSSSQNPNHTYYSSGVYTVTLIATSNNNCSNTLQQTLIIHPSPVASFTASVGCEGIPTAFTDSSFISSGNLTNWDWNFGDGSPQSSIQNPSHLYTGNGPYPVILTVTSNQGCTGVDTVHVAVYPKPIASFMAPNVCFGGVTSFQNQSGISSGTITSFAWDFGNFSQINNSQNPNYVYSSPGIFNVSLTAVSSHGCSSILTHSVQVYPQPTATFSATNACAGSSTIFTDLCTVGVGQSVNGWTWAFGDGSPIGNTQDPTHTYQQSGTYNVTLVGITNWGCSDTITKPVTVYSAPVVDLHVTDTAVCFNNCPRFMDASTISNGTLNSWSWSFGDGSVTSSLQNPTHCYASTGLYSITLTVSSSNGCFASATKTNYIHVYPVPTAAFSYSPQPVDILDPNVNFTDLSSAGVLHWGWDFGDYTGSSEQFPKHTYNDTGTYCITLIVENAYHCKDTALNCLRIEPEFAFYIPNAFSPLSSTGVNDVFMPKGIYTNKYQMWIFDRWGNQVFHTTDINIGWNGHVNNSDEVVQEDTYAYKIEVCDTAGDMHHYAGVVNLIK